jgi:VanZ family protein
MRLDVRMLHKFFVPAAWALLALIAYATISPIQARPTLPTSSSIEHLIAFLALGTVFCLAYPRQLAYVGLIVLGSAILLEILQLLTPDRHARILDAVEKIAGGAFGITAGRAMHYFRQGAALARGRANQPSAKSLYLAPTKELCL